MRKIILTASLALATLLTNGQSFILPHPTKWGEEQILFPIEFAPSIKYIGTEHLRFSPGWGDINSEELWSYCFLWWVKGDSKITRESLEADMTAYYTGLIKSNTAGKTDGNNVRTVASFKEAKGTPDLKFSGTVTTYDYMSLKPVTLNVNVFTRPCASQNRLAIFFEVSPQPSSHRIWKDFQNIWNGFSCDRK